MCTQRVRTKRDSWRSMHVVDLWNVQPHCNPLGCAIHTDAFLNQEEVEPGSKTRAYISITTSVWRRSLPAGSGDATLRTCGTLSPRVCRPRPRPMCISDEHTCWCSVELFLGDTMRLKFVAERYERRCTSISDAREWNFTDQRLYIDARHSILYYLWMNVAASYNRVISPWLFHESEPLFPLWIVWRLQLNVEWSMLLYGWNFILAS